MADLVRPEMPEFYSPFNTFLKGFSATAAISDRRQKEELMMQKMTQDYALKQQAFLNQQQQADIKNERASSYLNLAGQRVQLASDAQDFKEQSQREKMEDTKALMEELSGVKARQGTAEYNKALTEIAAKHPHAATDSLGSRILSKAWSGHEIGLKGKVTGFNSKLRQYGLPYDAFENPESWQVDPAKPGKRFLVLANAQDPQGQDPVKFPKSFVTIKDTTFKQLANEHQDIMGANVKIPTPASDSDVHVRNAKAAIAAGAPREAVAAKLQDEFGIDPDRLDQE